MSLRLAVLMPSFNERGHLGATLAALSEGAPALGDVTVFLVDDASSPPIDSREFPRASGVFRIVLARHTLNLGQGAALETARQLALRDLPFDAYVTMDADGQHVAADAFKLARAVQGGADVAFGNRFLGDSNVPRIRRIVLFAARLFEWIVTGLRLSDAHNGLRAFSREALQRVPIRQARMAHATEIKQRVSRETTLSIIELPVSLRYTEETLAKGQRSLGLFAIVHDLLAHYLFGEAEP